MTEFLNQVVLLDVRCAQMKGLKFESIKLVFGNVKGEKVYALFGDQTYIGSLDGTLTDQQVLLAGLGIAREIIAFSLEYVDREEE